jgi:hypothetical protein
MKKISFLLYGLFCPNTLEIKYVGITTRNLITRFNEHLKHPTNHIINNWINSLNKNNQKPLIKLITEYNNYDDLLLGEINEIKKYRELGVILYNMSDGGDINPMQGKHHTEESRKKISEVQKGRIRTIDEKNKQKERLKELWNDINWSIIVREKFKKRPKRLGQICSDKTKKLISEIHKKNGHSLGNTYCLGHKHSDITKMKMSVNNSGVNNPMFGKTISKESSLKRSKNVKKNGTYIGKNNPNYKYDINKNELFDMYINKQLTLINISKIYGCSISNIKKKLKEYKIKKPNSNKYNLSLTEIITYKENGLNLKNIGEIYGCSNKIIFNFLKRHGK